MAITELPDPPSRSDPINFALRADAFMAALPVFAEEANDLQADVSAKQLAAAAAGTAAIESAAEAEESAAVALASKSSATDSAATASTAAAAAAGAAQAAANSALEAAAAVTDIASHVTVVPAGNVTSTDVQSALEELDQIKVGIDDAQWLGKAVGERFDLDFDAPLPPTDNPRYRFIILEAGLTGPGGYNEGALTDETVTGTAPTITATAKISLAGSPLIGQTKRLINTTREFPRPGTASSVPEAGQNAAHNHTVIAPYGAASTAALVAAGGEAIGEMTKTTSSSGGNENRPRNVPARYLQRIL